MVFTYNYFLMALYYLSTFFESINLKENYATGTKRRRTRLDRQLKESNDTTGSRIALSFFLPYAFLIFNFLV